MVRYLLRIGYIGTKYRGTQGLSGFPNETIQGVVEQALAQLGSRNTPRTQFASRTDKGVHALTNTFHVDLDHKKTNEAYQPNYIRKELNAYFANNGHEIVVKSALIVHDQFHARFYAQWRSYKYRLAILRPEIKSTHISGMYQEFLPICEINRCHVAPSSLNLDVVKTVVEMFRGEHNYGAFTKLLDKNPWINPCKNLKDSCFYLLNDVKQIDDPQYDNIVMWEFYFRSSSFLQNQIRKLVGTALSAGYGIISLKDVQFMLDNPSPKNWKKCRMAPPCGLFLSHVEYDQRDLWSAEYRKQRFLEKQSLKA